MEMGFHHGSSSLSRSQYLRSKTIRMWRGSSSLETGWNHKIWNNPSFSIKIVISAHSRFFVYFCFFFEAICCRPFDQSKVSIYQCPKCRSLNSLTNIINLIIFKWKLETGRSYSDRGHAQSKLQIRIQIQMAIHIRTWRSQEINISVDWHARPLRVKCDSISSFVWHSLDVFKSESIPKQINDLICIHRNTKRKTKTAAKCETCQKSIKISKCRKVEINF